MRRAARPAARSGTRSTAGSRARCPSPIGPARWRRSAGIRSPRLAFGGAGAASRSTRRPRPRSDPPSAIRPGELLVRGLNGEEPGQGGLTGSIRMVDLCESAIGAPDLVLGRARREPQDAPWIGA
jgi:hypothetical protein